MTKEDYQEEEALAKMVSNHHNQVNNTDKSVNEIMEIFSLKDKKKKNIPNISTSENNNDEKNPINEIPIIGEEIVNNNNNKKNLQDIIQFLLKNANKLLNNANDFDSFIEKKYIQQVSKITKDAIEKTQNILKKLVYVNNKLQNAKSKEELNKINEILEKIIKDLKEAEETLNSAKNKYYSILSVTANSIAKKSCSANKTLKSNIQRKEDHLREKQRKERKKKFISTILILCSITTGGLVLHKAVTPHVNNFIEQKNEKKQQQMIEEEIKNKFDELRNNVIKELADDNAIYINIDTNEILRVDGHSFPSLYDIKLDSVEKAYIVYSIMGDFEFNKILQKNGYMNVEEFLKDFGYEGNYDNFKEIAIKEIEKHVIEEYTLVGIIDNGEEITIKKGGGRR